MTEDDISLKLEEVLADKKLKTSLGLTKDNVYHLRHRSQVEQKLKLLWQANKLTFK